MFIPVPMVAEVVTQFLYPSGNRALNVWTVRNDSAEWTESSLEDLLDVFEAQVGGTQWLAQVSNQITFTRLYARALYTQFGEFADRDVTHIGTNASPAMPANVTVSVKLASGFTGRSRRGRKYWIGLAENAVSGDFITTGFSAAIQLALSNLAAALIAQDFRLGIVSYVENGVPREEGLFTPVTSIVLVDDRVDTQRRRLTNAPF